MTDFARLAEPFETPRGMVATYSQGSQAADAVETLSQSTSGTGAVWVSALRVLYFPVVLQRPYLITKGCWHNGGTVNGNVDIGIYDENGTRLVSTGSTAQTTTNTVQVADVTDTTVGPGVVYLAMVSDSATGLFIQSLSVTVTTMMRAAGVLQQTLGAMPLPSTWTTPSAYTGTSQFPIFGFSYDNAVLA